MKRAIGLFIAVGAIALMLGCSKDNVLAPGSFESDQTAIVSKAAVNDPPNIKPAPNLKGTMALFRNPDYVFNEANPYIEPAWEGEITFEDGSVYGMRFFHLSPKKGYSQASPFEEYFEIFDLTADTVVYLAGPDVGATITANKPPDPAKYGMNGTIDVANPPFEMWMGRNVRMSGHINYEITGTNPDGTPKFKSITAPGEFRIN